VTANKETATNTGAGTQIAKQTGEQKQQASQRVGQEYDKTLQAQQAGKGLDYQEGLGQQAQGFGNIEEAQPVLSALEARAKTQFTGPKEISAQGELQQKARNLQETSDLTKNESGRFALLKNTFGKPTYNQGQQRLDQLLVQNDPTQQKQLQGIRKLAGGLNQELKGAVGGVAQSAADLEAAAADTRTKTLADVGGASEGINQTLAQRVAAFNAAEAQRAAGARDQSVDLAAMGMGGIEAGWNPDLGVYDNQAQKDANLARSKAELASLNQEMAPLLGKAFGTYNQSNASLSNIDPQKLAVMNALRRISGQEEISPAAAAAQQGKYGVQTGGEGDTEKNMNVIRQQVQGLQVKKEQLAPDRAVDFARHAMGVGTEDEQRGRGDILRSIGIDPDNVKAAMQSDEANRRIQEKLSTWRGTLGIDRGTMGLDRQSQFRYSTANAGQPFQFTPGELAEQARFKTLQDRAMNETSQELIGPVLAEARDRLSQQQRDTVRSTLERLAAQRG
jgi:hypothetical protein